MTPAPIIVCARLGGEDFAWLNGLRRTHFPPERNQLSAHLTLFHHLPPSSASELHGHLTRLATGSAPSATIDRVIMLGRGVAFGVRSPELGTMRAELADIFAGLLTPQDAAGWRPHITIQNKAEPAAAKALHATLLTSFEPRPLDLVGLATFWYRGGPWEQLGNYPFRGFSRSGRFRRS